MNLTITQIFLTVFLLFALSRVLLRFREGILPPFGLILWSGIFLLAVVIVLFPGLTSTVANAVGIGRGADIVIYISISLIFYLLFRLYTFMEDIRHDITDLVRKLAVKNTKKKNDRRSS